MQHAAASTRPVMPTHDGVTRALVSWILATNYRLPATSQ